MAAVKFAWAIRLGGDRNDAPDGGFDETGPDNVEPGNGDFGNEGSRDNRYSLFPHSK